MDINALSSISYAVYTAATVQIAMTGHAEHRQANILFCITDDAGHMSAYRTPWPDTPAFDHVAGEGILFNNAYACNTKSAPPRVAIIIGRNSWQPKETCGHWPSFPVKFRSYPEALAENGYCVSCTGKGWGLGIANDAHGRKREITGKGRNRRELEPPIADISKIDYVANFEDFMKDYPKDCPFCFWYGALEPHRSHEYGSSVRAGKQTEQIDTVPKHWPDNELVRIDMPDYALEIEHFNKHLGRILRILEEKGRLESTIIVVTSDHGMPFPWCKGQECSNSNHIPMAVIWKNGIKKLGQTVDDYISLIDIVPTLLEAVGVRQDETGMKPITGGSLIDILKNKKTGTDRGLVMISKERHDVGRLGDQGHPIRGMTRGDYLYLKNFEAGRWPVENPEAGYMNVDGSPTKTEVLKAKHSKETAYYWQLSFGKCKAKELYNIRRGPDCMTNLAEISKYETPKRKLEKEVTLRLVEQGDPRIFGRGGLFDKCPNMSPVHQFRNRTEAGGEVRSGWTNPTDFRQATIIYLQKLITRGIKLVFCITALSLFIGSTTQAKSKEEEIKIFAKPLKDSKFGRPDGQFNYDYKAEPENLVLFWDKSFRKNPATYIDKFRRFYPDEILREGERFYTYHVDKLKFADKEKSLSSRYRMIIRMYSDDKTIAYGWGKDGVGMMRMRPYRVRSYPYCALVHEMGYSFQFMVGADSSYGSIGHPLVEYTSQRMP